MPGNPFLAPKSRPIVVGHRGVPALHQENTLAGFRRAIELGVPAVELDVRLSADRRAVCIHDHRLDRLTGTDANVIDLTWDQLSKLRIRRELAMGVDAGGGDVVARYDREEPIPLLAEVLAEVGDKVAINVELKISMPRWWRVDVGAVVAGELAAAGLEDRVIVTSFDPRKLRSASRARPGLAVGFCYDDSMLEFARPLLDRLPIAATHLLTLASPTSGGARSNAERCGGTIDRRPGLNGRHVLNRLLDAHVVGRLLDTRVVGAEHTLVGERTVERLHRLGVAIGTHTLFPIGSTTGKPIAASASTEAEVDRLVGLGVDWIETDDPERLLALMP